MKKDSANQPADVLDTENEEQDGEGGENLGTTGQPASKRDANDEKIMALSPDNKPGREVAASLQTLNNNRNSEIKSYYEFPSSKNEAVETYPNRVEKLSELLGNKDTVRG